MFELNVIQCVLLAAFSMVSSVSGALGTSYAWYTLSRPLVASLFVGAIMGEMTTAIVVGSAIQVVYIALVTPGGTVSADLGAVSWIGVPLSVAAVVGSGIDPLSAEAGLLAVPIAAAVGTLGTVFFYSTALMNLIWQQIGWKAFDKHDYKTVFNVTFFLPAISHFVIRFIPTFLILRYGLPYVANIKEIIPMDSIPMKTLFTVGSLLPAVGIAILLKMVVKKPLDLAVFFFGFTLAAAMKINLIGATFVGCFFAYLNYRYTMQSIKNRSAAVTEEEEL